jgi:hypothetical protein
MLQDYREIVYGILLGIAAAAIDTAIDGHMEGHGFGAEISGHPGMLLYRSIFILFGLIIGGLAWRNNRRKRDFRHLLERIKRFHEQFEGHVVVLHAKLQILLTKDSFHLSPEAQQEIRAGYEESRELLRLVNERPPVEDAL